MATKKVTAKKAAAHPGHTFLKHEVTSTQVTIMATAAGCLDPEDAIDLVESCVGGPRLKLSTPLSSFLASDPARRLFCDRVRKAAADAGCVRPFPSAPGTTLGDIADALSC